ncbi:GNAT domain-containing protein [Coniochaeta sp. 2T2.1]|nr:GNAT domain-containing protein [Coniochaeta sp. 2T2.1]
MRTNEHTAISTPRVLLVPYEHRHVLKYHGWMQDPAIQEATASEPLTLEEEYANQESWRTSHDKLTFIVCQPLPDGGGTALSELKYVEAGDVDSEDRMVGDINFFIYPSEDDDDDDEDGASGRRNLYQGEVDIMIADEANRGNGLGRAAVAALLYYIATHAEGIMREYVSGEKVAAGRRGLVMARIKAENVVSIALFKGLGFEQVGEVNYFGEIKMVLPEERFTGLAEEMPCGYEEVEYRRGTVYGVGGGDAVWV